MRVFCAGTFDVITVGHINLLLYCREQAGLNGEVWVSLDSDAKIRLDKGPDRPIFEWIERASAIESLKVGHTKIVDKTLVHDSNEYLDDMIKRIVVPDLIIVGADYMNKRVVGSDVCEVRYFARDYRFSSTRVIESCRRVGRLE